MGPCLGRLSWEWGRGGMQGVAMEVGALSGLSWERGHGDMQRDAMEVGALRGL